MKTSGQKLIVAVTAATGWTQYDSPRAMDEPALSNPVDLAGWLSGMSIEDKLEFHDRNLIQTQALYGTIVEVLEEYGDWVKVAIQDQRSHKDERGYPCWMPRHQLAESEEYVCTTQRGVWAVVTQPKARLYHDPYRQGDIVSFQTRLPVLSHNEEWVTVSTPIGQQMLRAMDVIVTDGKERKDALAGQRIVEAGRMFLDLPYLWGGLSSFGYDCSGFAYSMHRSQGITIPRDASDQAQYGWSIPTAELEPGDLLFFAREEGKGAVHHVGIYAGDGMMIHSPETLRSIEIIPLRGYKYEREHCISRRYWM
ncbi:C40 family peptidase [Aneurinibacillus sp. REN35]|uniref:C40 family peptidase n=1 Tax=Aneurinibacillus sp. REN35 TaxID=3237286 RepID=UPI003528903B